MSLIVFATLMIAFSFVTETLLLTFVTKMLRFKRASVQKAAQAVFYGCVLMLFMGLPLLFVFDIDSPAFDVGLFITGLIAGVIVIRNLYETRWGKAFIASVLVACLWGLITSLLWMIDGMVG